MLNSILHMTSSNGEALTPDKRGLTGIGEDVSEGNHSSNNQHPMNSFADQFSQFRQNMQVYNHAMGNSLPDSAAESADPSQLTLLSQLAELSAVAEEIEQYTINVSAETPQPAVLSESQQESAIKQIALLSSSILANINTMQQQATSDVLPVSEKQSREVQFMAQALEQLKNSLVLTETPNSTGASAKDGSIKIELPMPNQVPKAVQQGRLSELFSSNPSSSSSSSDNLIADINLAAKKLVNSEQNTSSAKLELLSSGSQDKPNLNVSDKNQPAALKVQSNEFLNSIKQELLSGDGKNKQNGEKLGVEPVSRGQMSELNQLKDSALVGANNQTSKISSLALLNGVNATASKGMFAAMAERTTDGQVPTIDSVTMRAPAITESVPASQLPPVVANSNFHQGLALRNDFSPNLALRIQWIYQQALSSAEILMDPPELGPLSIKMQHRGGETNIVFQVNNPQTKEMIEENLAKLRDLLQEQGIALGDTQVKQNQKQTDDENNELAGESEQPAEASLDEMHSRQSVGLLDTYI